MIPYGLPLIYSTLPVTPRLQRGCFVASLAPAVGVTSKKEANKMTTKTLSKSDLAQFTGSENWYRHGINRNVSYTDGRACKVVGWGKLGG
jgi:hypothetical protein